MEQETNGVETSEIKGGLDTALFAVERGPRTKLQIFDVSIQRVLTKLRVICPTGDLVLFRPEVSLANGCIVWTIQNLAVTLFTWNPWKKPIKVATIAGLDCIIYQSQN